MSRFGRFSSAGGFAVFHKVRDRLLLALAVRAEDGRAEGWDGVGDCDPPGKDGEV